MQVSEWREAVRAYLKTIEDNLRTGHAGEHTHRAALQKLVESLQPNTRAINEPGRSDFGAIDFLVQRPRPGGMMTIGYIEAKDVGTDLDRVERSEQLVRYRKALPNLILTDYLEFRWYLNGDLRARARLGSADHSGRIARDTKGLEEVHQLLEGFISQSPPSISNPRELAIRMAELAHTLRDQVIRTLEQEQLAAAQGGSESKLILQLAAFRETLLPDLQPEDFADMYAQTIAYGLFTARIMGDTATTFNRYMAAHMLPRTNPFLRQFFDAITGPGLSSAVDWIVDAIADLLSVADMAAIMRDFGRATRQEDPVVHFYETFLAEYDPKVREMRGVYYTPEPVVSYIVRSVDRLLQEHFGQEHGLADPNTIVLDPATGTGTFLYDAILRVHESLLSRGLGGLWQGYVAERLIPRIFGFELLMAPYAVAHLKLSWLLRETGYNLDGSERIGVYLTNTLAEAVQASPLPFAESISQEANAAAEIKRDKPIMVVLGNPPYSGHSANRGEWIGNLLRDYYQVDGKPLGERNPKWLQDDYVKFIRFGQWRINRTGQGILAYISNHSYLDNPTFRGMRQSLMHTFDHIYLLDLHGNTKKKEKAPDGGPDENVFDIQQGVCIGIFVKTPGYQGPTRVFHADLWGRRGEKYRYLGEQDVTTTQWQELHPTPPLYLFKPRQTDLAEEYERGPRITDIMPVNSVGIVTARDKLAIQWSSEDMLRTVRDFVSLPPEEARQRYNLGPDVRDWKVSLAQQDIRDHGVLRDRIVPVLYRPFDVRYTYYTGRSRGFICMPRPEVMGHMLRGENVGISSTRSIEIGRGFEHLFATRHIVQHHTVSIKEVNYLFPLYLYPEGGGAYSRADAIREAVRRVEAMGIASAAEVVRTQQEIPELVRSLFPREEYARWPNFAPAFIAEVAKLTGLRFEPEGWWPNRPESRTPGTFTPEDLLGWIYAVLHSPSYRTRYADFLRSDFPRVPLPPDGDTFLQLADLGLQLIDLHTLRDPSLGHTQVGFPQPGDNIVEAPRYDEQRQVVWINRTQHFTQVPREAWEFHIGGYQVAEKWLKDRKGRRLSYEEIETYRRIIEALRRTRDLMSRIDQVWVISPAPQAGG